MTLESTSIHIRYLIFTQVFVFCFHLLYIILYFVSTCFIFVFIFLSLINSAVMTYSFFFLFLITIHESWLILDLILLLLYPSKLKHSNPIVSQVGQHHFQIPVFSLSSYDTYFFKCSLLTPTFHWSDPSPTPTNSSFTNSLTFQKETLASYYITLHGGSL